MRAAHLRAADAATDRHVAAMARTVRIAAMVAVVLCKVQPEWATSSYYAGPHGEVARRRRWVGRA